MKKKKIIYTALVLAVLLCFAHAPVKEYLEWRQKPEDLSPNAMRAWEWESIGQVIEYTETVVTAEVIKISEDTRDGSGYVLTLQVEDVLFGNCEYDEIILYNELHGDHMKLNENYLLFLQGFNLYAYPENAYSLSAREACYTYDSGRLKGTSKLADKLLKGNNNTLEKMKAYLSNIPVPYGAEEEALADSFDSVEEMYKAAAIVAKVRITSVYNENENVDLVKIEVLESCKGAEMGEDFGYLWPAYENLEEGKEYYVFLDEDTLPIARNGSIIGESSPKWQEADELLNS